MFVRREKLLIKPIGRSEIESFLVEAVNVFVVFVGYGEIEFACDAILFEVVGQLVAKIVWVYACSYIATVRVV